WLDYLARQVVQGQASGEWRSDLDPWRAVYRLYGLYLGDQVFHALALSEDPAATSGRRSPLCWPAGADPMVSSF
ncbi:hypothetical protein DA11_22910, partial [Aeromonas caviae]